MPRKGTAVAGLLAAYEVRAALFAGDDTGDLRAFEALATVRRSLFVPPELSGLSRRDEPIPIGLWQTTSQPSLIARMVESLEIEPHDVVLEVGTGFGYEAAVLAQLARAVYTIERLPGLALRARANLVAAGVQNVEVALGDGALGLPERAPFDAILVDQLPEDRGFEDAEADPQSDPDHDDAQEERNAPTVGAEIFLRH